MEKWTEDHRLLQDLMKQEADLMEQLLKNLHQEETFLLNKTLSHLASLLEEKNKLLSALNHVRQRQKIVIKALQSTSSFTLPPLETLFPQKDERVWEVFTLKEQISSLLDKINLQINRNELLSQCEKQPQHLPNKKKSKLSVMILPPKNDETA